MKNQESYFDGGLLQLIGYNILGILVTVFTLGIIWQLAKMALPHSYHFRNLRFLG